jgi:hypothetical protein
LSREGEKMKKLRSRVIREHPNNLERKLNEFFSELFDDGITSAAVKQIIQSESYGDDWWYITIIILYEEEG